MQKMLRIAVWFPKRLSLHVACSNFHVKFNLPDSAGQTEQTRIGSLGREGDRGVRRSCCSSWAAANQIWMDEYEWIMVKQGEYRCR